jgi:hypothetical protein
MCSADDADVHCPPDVNKQCARPPSINYDLVALVRSSRLSCVFFFFSIHNNNSHPPSKHHTYLPVTYAANHHRQDWVHDCLIHFFVLGTHARDSVRVGASFVAGERCQSVKQTKDLLPAATVSLYYMRSSRSAVNRHN